MEHFSFTLYSTTALVALLAKLCLVAIVKPPVVKTSAWYLFSILLFTLLALNATEFYSYFHERPGLDVVVQPGFGYAYYTFLLPSIALMLHLSLQVSRFNRYVSFVMGFTYCYLAILLVLLWTSPYLIAGFVESGFTYTRIPGPLYSMLIFFVLICLSSTVGLSFYNYVSAKTENHKKTALVILISLGLPAVLILAVLVLQQSNFYYIGTPFLMPIVTTVLIALMIWFIYDFRFFSLSLKTNKEKSDKSYRYLQSWIERLIKTTTPGQLAPKIASLTNCPVAFISTNDGVLASTNGIKFDDIPINCLESIKNVFITSKRNPSKYQRFNELGISAVIPYGSSWLVLGNPKDNISFDFAADSLIEVMNSIGLERLAEAQEELERSAQQLNEYKSMESELEALEAEMQRLEQENAMLHNDAPKNLGPLEEMRDKYETLYIRLALKETAGHQKNAAKLLSMANNTLHNKLKKLGIDPREFKK